MSIFGDNITTELSFETVVQEKYSQAIRRTAALCWMQNLHRDGFERTARWQITDEIGPMVFFNKKYKFLHEETRFMYQPKGDKRDRVWVTTTIFLQDKKTGESIGYDFSESVLLIYGSI